jgi:hypothetical protein
MSSYASATIGMSWAWSTADTRLRARWTVGAIAPKKARMRLLEHLPGVYQTLARKAEDGSHEHIGLFLSITAGQPRGECKELEPIGGTGDDKYASK